MKQRILIIAVVSALLSTSCLKEGDLDRFRHDMLIEVDLNPQVGLPLGTAEVSIAELLGMFKNSTAKVLVDNNGLVTIYYDTLITTTVNFENDAKSSKGRTSAKGLYTKYQEDMTGTLDIDLFKNLSHMPGGDSLVINRTYATLLSTIVAVADSRTDEFIIKHGAKLYFNSVKIYAECGDGSVVEIPVDNVDSIPIRNLSHQADTSDIYHMMDSTDLAFIINKRPQKLSYSMKLNIDVPTSELAANPSMAVFMRDSLGLSRMDVNAKFSMYVPCILYVNGLEYTTDIEFNASKELKELELDSSYIYINVDNKLPFEFRLSCGILNADSVNLGYLFSGDDAIVSSANIRRADNSSYEVSSSMQSVITIPLDSLKMQALKNAVTLQLHSAIRTAPSSSGQPMVAIHSRDAMAFRLTGIFKPHFHQEIELGGRSKKGGAQ
ncbi:MAG: hypothetical protein IJU81_07040 [Bacteroidales bacterium]|nr:hypothetical protein [Bacteroidales bacterium]